MNKKIISLLALSLFAAITFANKLYLADDLIYYYPYADGTASVSGARVEADSLFIPTHIMIPDGYLTDQAADPEHMSQYRVTVIGEGAFRDNNGYSYVQLPDSLERIDDQAFYSCSRMVIPSFPPTITRIGQLSFYGCTNLTAVELPSITKMSESAFYRCTRLKSVTIGNQLDTLPKNAFTANSSLTTVDLGSGLQYIGVNAFSRCTSLQSITSRAVTPPVMEDKALAYVTAENITLYVPCNSQIAYSYAANWNKITNIQTMSSFKFSAEADPSYGFINIIHEPSDCNNSYCELEAIPNIDYVFSHWSDGTTDAHYIFTQTSDTALVAYFEMMEKDTIYDTLYICENKFPYYWALADMYIYDNSTQYYNEVGYPHVRALTLDYLGVNEEVVLDTTICSGSFVEWRGKIYTEPDTYYDTLVNQFGCDSVLIFYLNVIPSPQTQLNATICDGETLSLFSDTLIATADVFTRTYIAANGCDSVVTLTVTQGEEYAISVNVECYLGTKLQGSAYGEVNIERAGRCNNEVTLTAQATNNNYHFSHYLIGDEATGINPLSLELTESMVVRAIFYDNDRTLNPQISGEQTGEYLIYDLQGRLLQRASSLQQTDLPHGVYILKTAEAINKIAL